jgi:hypothetical protein
MLLHKGLGTTWGPSPPITLWLYTGIVRPTLTYGAAIWSRAAAKRAMAAKLKKIQRLGMIIIAPIRRNTPMSGLEIALGVLPLDLHIQYLASSTYNRLNLTPNGWTGQSGRKKLGHIKWLESSTRSLPHRDLQDRCVLQNWQCLFSTFIGYKEDS